MDVVFSETTFTNDRQKAEVIVTKQDKDTENPLDGGIFGLYSASDITNADGAVVVKKGTLIQKATTGADGTAKFTADLPLGFSYDVKEVQAPEGYVRNTEDVYTFAFSYTNASDWRIYTSGRDCTGWIPGSRRCEVYSKRYRRDSESSDEG